MRAYRSPHCSRQMELQYSHIISNVPRRSGKPLNFTCCAVSKSESGAGLTSVMSCDAAEVMSDPAD